VVAVFASGVFAGPHKPAADVLADPDADTALLYEPYAVDQSLVAEEEVDLNVVALGLALRISLGLTSRSSGVDRLRRIREEAQAIAGDTLAGTPDRSDRS
jgi:hypothetical protein